MEFTCVTEHFDCGLYSKTNNRLQDNGQAIIEFRIDNGNVSERQLQDTEIIFVLEGVFNISRNGMTNIRLEKGQGVLIPIGHKYIGHAETNARVMIFKVPAAIELCSNYSLNNLYEDSLKIKPNGYSPLLRMNDRIWTFTDNVHNYLNDGFRCCKFLSIKVSELMYLLRAYYTTEELAAFFQPILNRDIAFANIILENWPNVKNKAELAALTNLSPSRFGVKFKEVFGISPYQWLINQRSERIYYELVYTNNTLKKISRDFRFGSVQHFNDFCKKQFNKTPGNIRESHRKS